MSYKKIGHSRLWAELFDANDVEVGAGLAF